MWLLRSEEKAMKGWEGWREDSGLSAQLLRQGLEFGSLYSREAAHNHL